MTIMDLFMNNHIDLKPIVKQMKKLGIKRIKTKVMEIELSD